VRTTPEQILTALENEAFDMEETARVWGGESQAAPPLRAAAALIRKQSEALKLIIEMDGDQPARSDWDMLRIARKALGVSA
jgi:hypothetical protein